MVGILEDVRIKIGKFFIYVDFLVLEIEDSQVLIIFGKPFLAIMGAIIDVKNEKLSLSVGDNRANLIYLMQLKILLLRILVA